MKKEDLMAAFDKVQPSPNAQQRMLENIIDRAEKRKEYAMGKLSMKKLVPVLGLAIIIAGSLLMNNLLSGRSDSISPEGEIQTDDLDAREDMVAPVTNQFRIDDRHYILLPDELREEFGFPAKVSEEDIGRKITVIESTPDESMKGLEVFEYIPGGGEAVVAVKKEDGYRLYKFFTFESYNNNQDEDAIAYLKLHGIEGPEDIKAVQLIEYTEESKVEGKLNIAGKITEPADIQKFYNYYSVLKNASDKYFEALFGYRPSSDPGNLTTDPAPDAGSEPDIGPAPDEITSGEGTAAEDTPVQAQDMPLVPGESDAADDMPLSPDSPVSSDSSVSSGMMDMGNTEDSQGSYTPPSQGSAGDALANPIAVRIYNKHGVYYETMYYRNIGFLSRYEVSKEFADFLNSYIGH